MTGNEQKVRLLVHSQEQPLTLIFEFWATEYVLDPHKSVVVELDNPDPHHPPEIGHLSDGICFWSSGDHPSVWTLQGESIEIF
ncbi:hypothetical protein ABZ806_40085 [Spirillospora sp. NPDC047418]|jgi:hypothetical protein